MMCANLTAMRSVRKKINERSKKIERTNDANIKVYEYEIDFFGMKSILTDICDPRSERTVHIPTGAILVEEIIPNQV